MDELPPEVMREITDFLKKFGSINKQQDVAFSINKRMHYIPISGNK